MPKSQKHDWRGQCPEVIAKGRPARDEPPRGWGRQGGVGVVWGARLSTPQALSSKVKVDFPNRHPRVSHQGTRVPLPPSPSPLLPPPGTTAAVRADRGHGRPARAQGLSLAQVAPGSPDLGLGVNSISFQSIRWRIFHYPHMWTRIVHRIITPRKPNQLLTALQSFHTGFSSYSRDWISLIWSFVNSSLMRSIVLAMRHCLSGPKTRFVIGLGSKAGNSYSLMCLINWSMPI